MTQLTPEQVGMLTPTGRAQTLAQLAEAHYGTKRYKTEIARDFDIARSTVATWDARPELIPAAVILCLSAWCEVRRIKTEAAAAVQDYSGKLKQLAERLQS